MEAAKEEYLIYRILKSDEALEDARLLAVNGRWNACINRLYYSSYYLISALLYKYKFSAHTHNGIKTRFFLEFVKTEKIDKESGKLFSSLFDWRQESDYADFVDFDKDVVDPLINKVYALNESLKILIRE
jgi:uncharacterized protein (UPF0332 family)